MVVMGYNLVQRNPEGQSARIQAHTRTAAATGQTGACEVNECGFPQSVAGVTSEPVHPPCLLGFRSELILPVLVLGQLACQPVLPSLGNGGISTTWGRWRKVYPRFANLSVELF